MKLPRDMDAPELIKALQRIGYRAVRQSGSHIRLQSDQPKPHAITVPNHSPLKLGTLASLLAVVAEHQGLTRDAADSTLKCNVIVVEEYLARGQVAESFTWAVV